MPASTALASTITPSAFALLVGAIAAGSMLFARPLPARIRSAAWLGTAAGLTIFATGVFGMWSRSLVAVLPVSLMLTGSCALLLHRSASEVEGAAPGVPGMKCLGVALGGLWMALLVGYVPAARSAAYALAELGAPFMLGLALSSALWPRIQAGPTPVLCAALTVATIALLNGACFFAYPDVLVSRSALAQTSSYVLSAGRVWPFWVLAFALGTASGTVFCEVSAGGAKGAALGAIAVAVLAPTHYSPAYVLPAGFALAAVALTVRRHSSVGGSRVLRAASCVVCGGALVWIAAGDMHMDWLGLRLSLGQAIGLRDEVGGTMPAAGRIIAEWMPSGLTATAQTDDRTAVFRGGNLALLKGIEGSGMSAVSLTTAVAFGGAERHETVAVVEPALPQTVSAVRRLTGCEDVGRLLLSEGDAQRSAYDMVICGPGPWSTADTPRVAFRAGMRRLMRSGRGDGSAVALWLPARTVGLEDLRSLLATVESAGQDGFQLFVAEGDAVLLSNGNRGLNYTRLAGLFDEPEREDMLLNAGIWHPADVLAAYVADSSELCELYEGVRPFTAWRPVRLPPTARDVTALTQPAALAALVQYRLLGPQRVLRRVQFEDQVQRALALQGFANVYVRRTLDGLSRLGQAGVSQQRGLVRFLSGPYARLDLFAPDGQERAVRLALALSTVGMREAAGRALKVAVERGDGSFAVHYHLGTILEALAQPQEALEHYRKAIELDPDSGEARRRTVGALLELGRTAEAADVLERLVKQQPASVPSLLMLGNVYARLGRYEDAADVARRALQIEPANADAQALLSLSEQAADAH